MKPHEKLGIAIADAGYTWTPEMRSAWEELDKQIAFLEADNLRLKGFCWETPEALEFLATVKKPNEAELRKAQEK